MKKIMAFVCMLALVLAFHNGQAQLRKIPAEVTDAFKSKYPSASGLEWKDKLTAFQADFDLKGEKHHARFNAKGEWQETENNIEQDKLPSAVKDDFGKSKYTGWEVKEVSYLEKKDESEQYRLLVRKSDLEKKYLFFNKSGKLLKDMITL